MSSTLQGVFVTKTQSTYIQFFRYGFVSIIALGVDFGGLVALKEYVHLQYLLSATISFIAGLLVNYLMSTAWVFHGSKLPNRRHEFLLFALIGLLGLGLTDGILWALTSGLGVYYIYSKMIATVVVYFWNFFARKKYIFL